MTDNSKLKTQNSKLITSASPSTNEHGQPIGEPVPGWTPRPLPPDDPMMGTRCRVERLDPARHVDDLWAALALDPTGRGFTYFTTGPFASKHEYRAWLDQVAPLADPRFFTIVDVASGKAVGVASYLRIDPANGVIEVGNIHFSPLLQRTPAATEAMYLMMRQAFTLGYRRYEWKCDALNLPSRRAAERFGFTFEGIFRQAIVYKGRNRDTAWYAIVDRDWPAIQAAFEAWLAPANFDEHGAQRRSLGDLTRPVRTDHAT